MLHEILVLGVCDKPARYVYVLNAELALSIREYNDSGFFAREPGANCRKLWNEPMQLHHRRPCFSDDMHYRARSREIGLPYPHLSRMSFVNLELDQGPLSIF